MQAVKGGLHRLVAFFYLGGAWVSRGRTASGEREGPFFVSPLGPFGPLVSYGREAHEPKARVSQGLSITGVRSPPPEGKASSRQGGLTGKGPETWRGAGFLGGARSRRPCGEAGRMRRHLLADPEDRVPPRGGGAGHGCLTGITSW